MADPFDDLSRHSFEVLVSEIEDYAIFMLDRDGRVLTWNRGAEKIKGYRATDILGRHGSVFYPPQKRGRLATLLQRATREGRATDEGWRLRSDGSRFWASVVITALRDETGASRGFIKITRDFTDRRRNEALFSGLLESAPDAMVLVEPSGAIALVNAPAERLFGYERAELVGRQIEVLVPTPLGEVHQAHRRSYLHAPEQRTMGDGAVLHARRKDGSSVPVEIMLSPVNTDDSQLIAAAVRDVSVRLDIEASLRARERQLSEAQRIAQLGSWEWEVTSDTVTWSPELCRIYGLPDDAYPRSLEGFLEKVVPDERDHVRRTIEDAFRDKDVFSFLHHITRSDGDVRRLHARGQVETDDEGAVRRMLGTGQDVTDRERFLEEIGRARRMLGIGQLAAGIAHDFNNILFAISSACDILGDADDETRTELLEHIRSSLTLGAGLTRRLVALGTSDRLDRKIVELSSLVDELVPILEPLMGSRTTIVRSLAANSFASVDAEEVKRALLNLASNARDAMPQGGYLTLAVASIAIASRDTMESPPVPPGDYVRVSVTDTGVGMNRETLARMAEPFFTTKQSSAGLGGVGLGLATVRAIVDRHGGHLRVASAPGRGTSFRMYFTAVPEALVDDASAEAPFRTDETPDAESPTGSSAPPRPGDR